MLYALGSAGGAGFTSRRGAKVLEQACAPDDEGKCRCRSRRGIAAGDNAPGAAADALPHARGQRRFRGRKRGLFHQRRIAHQAFVTKS